MKEADRLPFLNGVQDKERLQRKQRRQVGTDNAFLFGSHAVILLPSRLRLAYRKRT
jgi:hypothetical protein